MPACGEWSGEEGGWFSQGARVQTTAPRQEEGTSRCLGKLAPPPSYASPGSLQCSHGGSWLETSERWGEGAWLMPSAQVWVLFQSAAGPVHCFISRVLQGRPPPHPSDGEPHLQVPKLLSGLISCRVYRGSISVHGVGGLSPSLVLQSVPTSPGRPHRVLPVRVAL